MNEQAAGGLDQGNHEEIVRQGSVVSWIRAAATQFSRSRRSEEGRAVPAVVDHHQVIDNGKPVTAACCSDGTEGPILGFRGAGSAVAAVADEDAPARLAGMCAAGHRLAGVVLGAQSTRLL